MGHHFFGNPETLIWLIENYGYFFVFLLTLLEGETVVVIAGFASYQEHLKLGYVILIAVIGAVIGDQSFFYFGRLKGREFLARRPKLTARVVKIQSLVEHHQNWLIVVSRFMYGFRMIIPITIGTSKIGKGKYFLLDTLGAIIWAVFFSLGGYTFGGVLEQYMGHIKRAEKYIILGVITGIVIVQLIGFLRSRITASLEKGEETKPKDSADSPQPPLPLP